MDEPLTVCIIGNHYTEEKAIQKLLEKQYFDSDNLKHLKISELSHVWVKRVTGEEWEELSGNYGEGSYGYQWQQEKDDNGFSRKGTLIELLVP